MEPQQFIFNFLFYLGIGLIIALVIDFYINKPLSGGERFFVIFLWPIILIMYFGVGIGDKK